MKKENRWREIAKEMDFDPQQDPLLAQTLRMLTLESDSLSEVPIPQGYEDRLIQALRRKLPLERPKAARTGVWGRLAAAWTMPQFRIQIGAAMGVAVLALVITTQLRHSHELETGSLTESMLLKAARTSDQASVNSWIDSISDSIDLKSGRDIASLSEEMTKAMNSRDQKRVLNSFAGADGHI
jgi:hypothetical protein